MSLMNRSFRNVFRKKTRTLVVALALGLAIAAIISVYTGIEASTANTQDMIEEYEETIINIGELSETEERMITVDSGRSGGPGGGGPGGFNPGSQTPISGAIQENISAIENVEDVVPMITQRIGEIDEEEREQMYELRRQGGGGGGFDPALFNDFFDYFIQGVAMESELDDKYSILPSNIIAGRKLNENDNGNVMIRRELTYSDGFFAGATVGSYIEIGDLDFKVIGIYSSDNDRNTVYMSLSDARKVLDMEEGEASSLNVYATTKTAVDLVVYDINELDTGYTVMSSADRSSLFAERIQLEQERTINGMEADNDKIENTGNQIIFISIITAVLIVLFLMLYTVKERTREIGILKALGFPGKNIMTQFIIEGTIIGLIGGILGITIGIVGGPIISKILLPNTDVFATSIPNLTLVLSILILTITLGAIGTIYPAWEASKKHPVEAIRHE
jgi:ABC-type antimicrobial peptide transport system permease subunit